MARNRLEKSDEKPFPENDETRQIHRVAGYAFLLNLALAVMKALLAIFSGSLAISASAIDSGTDAVASLVIYGGVRLSSRKTRSFPMGLYKLENVASVVIALFIFIAGYEIIREILSPSESLPRIALSFIILLIAGTVATLLFGQYAISIGRRTASPTLIAEGRHRQVDVLSSIVVLISVTLSYFDVHLDILGVTIDRIGAALILIFIARAGWELLSDGMRVLLDASVDFSTLDQIREIIRSEPMVSEIKSLMGRNAGRFRFIQATVTVKTENLDKAHQISEDIEMKIRQQVTHLERVIIHYEPQERSHDRIALPLEDETGRISKHFGEAPYFGIVQIRRNDKKIEKQEILENPYRSVETAKGIRVAEWLVKRGIEHVAMKEDVSHKGPGYVLSNGGVKIHIISAGQLDQAISEI
ncbi:MAG: cation diffusion facilitator family transporter, partial [Deltaproteobacteria bacterium]|nr:cation diffusion facilitator family transporter [Deltaproteobacteria bacterium]